MTTGTDANRLIGLSLVIIVALVALLTLALLGRFECSASRGTWERPAPAPDESMFLRLPPRPHNGPYFL